MSSLRAGRSGAVDAWLVELLPANMTATSSSHLATLWSSYGHLYRISVRMEGSMPISLVLKHINAPARSDASISHRRKLKSYAVERYFYQHLASRLPTTVAVAVSYPTRSSGALLLEDLNAKYSRPASGRMDRLDTNVVLTWLAGFHATFWGQRGVVPPPSEMDSGIPEASVNGVWEQGTYFYLDTRQDELAAIDDGGEYAFLLPWASKVNEQLALERAAGRCTLLHGDAKDANIMFSPTRECALVDFQYVGAGVPTLDIAYFLGTSVRASLLQGEGEVQLLRVYHEALATALRARESSVEYSWDTFLRHWELALVDWSRFMAGWGFWGNDVWVVARCRSIVEKWSKQGFPPP
ncbi:kinase-like domain-containing protein [Auriculariales sp. MPI-PUGE-AT-0066]|nr:kinase-like domain-containing protein [Auriculariales sp. MPI-PUGE-AT-0066]